MSRLPLVSVIIPTYKRADLISKTIESVLSQTYENIEIIVVDDNDPNSKDRLETQKIMNKYEDNKLIKYICHTENKNGSAARNTGIKNSKGEYITFLDDDDEYLNDKIKLQVEKLESLDDSWGICYTQYVKKKRSKIIQRGIEGREGNLSTEVLKSSFYISAGSNILVRKSVIDKVGGFNETFLRRQDLEFLVRILLVTKIACVKKVCLVINKDDTTNVLTTEDKLKQNSVAFLEAFNPYISQLSLNEQKKIKIAHSLDFMRYYLIKFDLKSVYFVCKENDISFYNFIKYIGYLAKRKIFKLSYGFRV